MTQNNQPPANGAEPLEEAPENTNKPRSIFVGNAQWEKLRLIRDDLGSWNMFADVAIEQLLASGVLSHEIREAIRKINRDNGLDFLDDSSWKSAFKIREPWPETASNILKIKEELAAIKAGLSSFAQVVEDHATAMLDAELVRADEADE